MSVSSIFSLKGLLIKSFSFNDSHVTLLSFIKCGVTLRSSSSSIIFLSSLLNKFLFLFFSIYINGELEGVFCDIFDPLVDGSMSSLELSGISIFKLYFFCWPFSTLSSIVSSFISLISFFFEGIIFIVLDGFKSLGWSFWGIWFLLWLGVNTSKKSSGKIFLLFTLMFIKL